MEADLSLDAKALAVDVEDDTSVEEEDDVAVEFS